VVVVLSVLFAAVEQRRLMPLVVPEMQLPVGLVSSLVRSEQPLCLCFLAGLHPLRNDVGKPALADHLQNELAVKLPIHQHILPMELVSQALIGLLVLGGLAFHERVVNRLASLDTNSDLVTPDEKER
jgi:hypothetical protein